MKFVLAVRIAAIIIGVVCIASQAQAKISVQRITERSTKRMARLAHTPEQYRAVADSYHQLYEEDYVKAIAEKREWVKMREIRYWGKTQSPAESARIQYEYYAFKCAKMSKLEARYDKLAGLQ